MFAFVMNAQVVITTYTLTGTSYSQNFDGIGSGLPTGWNLFTSATATALGTIDGTYGSGSTHYGAYWDTTDCPSDVFGTGFKNCASADNGHTMATATCTLQESQTNRALGVRQSSTLAGFDPGASFTFKVANTLHDSDFTLTFKLQSLDSMCPRVTTWTLDYGLGATPGAFTPVTVTSGTMTTGGNTFANNTITATLPAAVNNQAQPMWIRISTLTATTGVWLRTTSAIDDVSLTWLPALSTTGITNIAEEHNLTLSVLGIATADKMTFTYTTTEEGDYHFGICDMSGRLIHSETIHALSGSQSFTISGLNLASGIYIAKLQNGHSASVARIAVQ